MSDFTSVVKTLDIVPARKATKDEATNTTQPFDKYYDVLKTRKIDKIYTHLILTPYKVNMTTVGHNLRRRLIAQVNVQMPKHFHLLNVKGAFPAAGGIKNCFLCIKWREGTDVKRYVLNPTGNYQFEPYFETYTTQLIDANCVFELWAALYQDFHVNADAGILQNLDFQTSIFQNPDVPENVVINLDQTPNLKTLADFGFTFPVNIPLNNPIIAWNDN